MQKFENDRHSGGRSTTLLSAPPLTGFLFLGLMMLTLIFAQQQQRHQAHLVPAPQSSQSEITDALKALADKAPKPRLPSAFEKEQAMSTAELLKRWDPMIEAASKRFGVPEKWIRAVIRQESGGRTMLAEGVRITSPVGAMGLMQLMPGTYKEMALEHGLGSDPFNAQDNINAGTAYLRWLHSRFGFSGMFAAYNAGPTRVQQGGGLPAETQNYVSNISRWIGLAEADGQSKRARRGRATRTALAASQARYNRTLRSIPLPSSGHALQVASNGDSWNVGSAGIGPRLIPVSR